MCSDKWKLHVQTELHGNRNYLQLMITAQDTGKIPVEIDKRPSYQNPIPGLSTYFHVLHHIIISAFARNTM